MMVILIVLLQTTLTLCSCLRTAARYFTNITEASGLALTGFFLQAKMEDFDNDGYVDLVFAVVFMVITETTETVHSQRLLVHSQILIQCTAWHW